MKFLKNIFRVIPKAGSEFINDNVLKLGAALSYYTIFSLPPLMLIIIWLSGIFFGVEAARGEIYGQIKGLVGSEAAMQVQEMIKNVHLSKENTWASILGIITLVLGASGVFAEIQDSINFIWGLKTKPKKGLVKMLRNRLMSFSMVVSLGFLLIVSLAVNAVMGIVSERLQRFFPEVTIWFFYVLNIAMMLAVITVLFAIIFKTLPDGKVKLKDAFTGALFTAILFMIGKWAIGLYLGTSNVLTAYGAAGALILILLWVYYSAIILYFGAEFTKVYAYTYGGKIIANDYAVHIKKLDLEVPAAAITEHKAKT